MLFGIQVKITQLWVFVILCLCWVSFPVSAQIQDEVYSISWSPDGAMIAISGGIAGCDTVNLDQFAIRVFAAETGQITKTLTGMTCTATRLDWSPDSSQLVSFNAAQTKAYIWDVSNGKVLRTVPFESYGMLSADWSPTSNLIASSFPGNGIVFWDANTGQITGPLLSGTTIGWSPDSSRVVAGSFYDSTLAIYDVTTGQELQTFKDVNSETIAVSWSPDGNRIASVSADENLRIWNAANTELLVTLNIPDVVDAQWSPDSLYLATAALDGNIYVWDVNTGAQLSAFTNPNRTYTAVWSPDGTKLAFGGKDNQVEIVDVLLQPTPLINQSQTETSP